jgi:bifunctional non-homologous end joining protein LigD
VVEVDDRGGGTIRVPNVPWRFSASPDVGVSGVPKYRGEDNRALLGELLGYDDDRLDRLEADGVLSSRLPGDRSTMALGFPVLPMKATMGSTGAVPEGDDWAFEIKWDGYRTIVHVADGAVRLQSSAGHDVTARWPEFVDLAGSVNASSAILDGELVVLGDDGRRGSISSSAAASARIAKLSCSSSTCCRSTVPTRSTCRTSTVAASSSDSSSPATTGWCRRSVSARARRSSRPPPSRELEGVIAKRVDSRYRPGTRTKDWRKIKNRTVVELTIGGFTTGTGNRAGTFGALLVGRPAPGWTVVRRRRRDRLRPTRIARAHRATPRPGRRHDARSFHRRRRRRRTATWVEPVLRATVEIAEFTNDGLVRHATFVDLAE